MVAVDFCMHATGCTTHIVDYCGFPSVDNGEQLVEVVRVRVVVVNQQRVDGCVTALFGRERAPCVACVERAAIAADRHSFHKIS